MGRLYLTERQDIIGVHENRSRFAKLIVDYGNEQAPDDPWQQVGTWILVGMTGRCSYAAPAFHAATLPLSSCHYSLTLPITC